MHQALKCRKISRSNYLCVCVCFTLRRQFYNDPADKKGKRRNLNYIFVNDNYEMYNFYNCGKNNNIFFFVR